MIICQRYGKDLISMSNILIKKTIDSIHKQTPKKSKKKKERDLRKPFEYAQFIKWIATPSVLRIPKIQGELEKEFVVSQGLLSKWKKRDGFWDEVRLEMKVWAKDKTPNVIQAIYQIIIKQGKGSPQAAKLWLQYIEQWAEGQEIKTISELTIKEKTTLEDIKKMSKKKRREFYAKLAEAQDIIKPNKSDREGRD